MVQKAVPDEERQRRKEGVEASLKEGFPPPGRGRGGHQAGAIRAAVPQLGINLNTVLSWARAEQRLAEAGQPNFCPDWSLWQAPEIEDEGLSLDDLRDALRKSPATLDALAERFDVSRGKVLDAIDTLMMAGSNIQTFGDRYAIPHDLPPAFTLGESPAYMSRPDNTFVFGVISDTHFGSQYARKDVANDLYDRFAEAEVDRVFHAGNWIEGEARWNRHELEIHGMGPQVRDLVANYPQREGIATFAVTGDDHEGWYAQREGVDIGRYVEQEMRAAGRMDWVNLGYMEAHVALVNANTKAEARLAVVHPGGGSAYAISYSIQKIIEALEGGEKPAVWIGGHFHKLWAGNIRNVWCLQAGCCQDQTAFQRKKRIAAHVGGAIVWLEQDPETGAIVSMTPKMIRYFNRDYYNGRWGHSGPVALPERAP
jgi:predicted phosphodiesterase